jgi:type IV pilus assembly protein PilW
MTRNLRNERAAPRSHQHGFSLIEIMVSLTIGLIILAAIGTVFVNSNNLTRQREDVSQLNDPSRVVMQTIRQDLMQAGYVDIFDLVNNPAGGTWTQASQLFSTNAAPGEQARRRNLFVRDTAPAAGGIGTPLGQFFAGLTPVFGCDGAMNDTPNGIVTAGPPLAPACGAADATQHSLRIAYQAVPITPANEINSLSAADPALGIGLDCLQQNPPAGVSLVINEYYVEDNAAGVPALRCRGSGAVAGQELAQGVEEFVLRYQVAAAPAAGVVAAAGGAQARYLSASDVSDVAVNPQGWAGVTAVEICLMSATAGPAATGTTALQDTRPTCARDADGTFADNLPRVGGDARLWKRFTTVVSLRNSVYATPI